MYPQLDLITVLYLLYPVIIIALFHVLKSLFRSLCVKINPPAQFCSYFFLAPCAYSLYLARSYGCFSPQLSVMITETGGIGKKAWFQVSPRLRPP